MVPWRLRFVILGYKWRIRVSRLLLAGRYLQSVQRIRLNLAVPQDGVIDGSMIPQIRHTLVVATVHLSLFDHGSSAPSLVRGRIRIIWLWDVALIFPVHLSN